METTEPQINVFGWCREGKVDELKAYFTEHPEDLTVSDQRGFTPLILAAYNHQVATVKLLLELGANPNQEDRQGNTALMGAAFKGDVEVAQALLELGADPNFKNYNGATALIFAASFGHAEVVKALLAHHADKSIADLSGKTALQHAGNNETLVGLLS